MRPLAALCFFLATADPLHLDDPTDRTAFRHWFTFLAEVQAWQPRAAPAEITDCAALIRFAYREALRPHDGEWARRLRLPVLPLAPGVEKYQYPRTPDGPGLFRTGYGDALSEFADAENLYRWNTHAVGRDLRHALPGDLLFFRQLEQHMPYHAMIFVGPGHFESQGQAWLVYHTGPSSGGPGEIRRVSTAQLARHPLPQWRPLEGNTNYLGVYRWNILREAE